MTPPDRVVAPRRARMRVGLGAVAVLVLVGLAVTVLVTALADGGATTTVDAVASPIPDDPAAATSAESVIYVHLLGAVARPGLYQLRDGDRVVDAIAAAGGFTDGADQAQVNLARRMTDGEQLYVPVVGELPAPLPQGGPAGDGKVNLNTADEAALDTLPGVGPATARRILEWREANGSFTAVEDLLSVPGIGDKTLAELKDLVTV